MDMVVENSVKVGLHGVVLLCIVLFVTCLAAVSIAKANLQPKTMLSTCDVQP